MDTDARQAGPAAAPCAAARRARPEEESATFKHVRQARRHELWRIAHPFDPAVAVRIICWFPANDQVVLALVGFDKKPIGDVFYMTEEVKFIRGDDRINQLAQRPDIAADVAEIRAGMAEAAPSAA